MERRRKASEGGTHRAGTFFEKKARKKLLLRWVMGCDRATAHAPAFKSFCAAFFKKRLLP
jgi:hypothetical protein